MSAQFSLPDADKKIAEIDLEKYIQHMVKERKLSLRKLSVLINEQPGFLSQQLKRKTIDTSLLYTLTIHLKVNFFEPFLNQLPDHLRATQREKALQDEIEALKKQLADVSKERDMLEKIVMK